MEIQALKFLKNRSIPFETITFPESTEKGASNVAKVLLMNERAIIKTLIFEDQITNECVLVMVGANQKVQSKNLKKIIGSRNIALASPEKVKEITKGFEIGAIPAHGWQPENFCVFMEASLFEEKLLGVGTGHWGNEILIKPLDLFKSLDNITVKNITDGDKDINDFYIEEINKLGNNITMYEDLDSEFLIKNQEIIEETDKTIISLVSKSVDKYVTISGWMYNKRSSGSVIFLQIRDGSGFIQCIVNKTDVSSEVWEIANKLTIESSCTIKGLVKSEIRSQSGFEIDVKDIQIVSISPEYPIGKKEHGVEFLFKNRDLYLRSKTPWAILRIRDQIFRSITNFYFEENFVRVDTPVFQPTSCEDTTELFEVDYFGKPMYLTQSGQLYSEASVMSLGKVYDFGPVFRAEKSKTRNHLTEFWMMDAEMAFFNQKMNEDVQEKMVKRIIKDCIENMQEELKLLERDTTILENSVKTPFIRIKHFEAKSMLEKNGFTVDYEDDMTTDEEIWIGNHYKIPVFIEDYPFAVKAFYMKSFIDERGLKRARCADLIAPEEAREIIGGSQREDNYNVLLKELKERNYPVSEYEWYLNVRKHGSVPHAGFGLGLERMVRWISGTHHIRETSAFPRSVIINRP